jgi:hypothetical protein
MKLGVPTSRKAIAAFKSAAASWSAVGSGAPHRFRRRVGSSNLSRPIESGVAAPSGLCHRTPGRCRAPRRPGVFGAQSLANTSRLLRRITRRLGPLAPVVQMANTRRSFRGEGWGEGHTLLPTQHSLFPSPSPFPLTNLPNQPGSLAKEITRLATCTPPNTPGLRPARLRHSSF